MSVPSLGTLIVGSEGQDGRVLQKILATQGKKIYRQSRNQIISPDGKSLGPPSRELLNSIFSMSKIDEVYFLAATHSPARLTDESESRIQLKLHFEILENALVQILETIKSTSPTTRFFFASSALIYGEPKEIPQTENTSSAPIEIYGLFKTMAQEIVSYYRNSLGIFAISGILYPHESEFRKGQFLFMKILQAAKLSSVDPNHRLEIVDLDFTREWNCAYQVMECGVSALRIDNPDDFIIGSGKQESVREVCKYSFEEFDLDYEDYIVISPAQMIKRSTNLLSDSTKLLKATGLRPDGDVKSLISRTIVRMQEI
jgi:GDPmannose 4,6-dehydratase